jgi:hypothetical protein
MFKKLLIGAALVAGSGVASAGPILLDEGFESFTLAGWGAANNGTPGGSIFWQTGNTGIFPAASGSEGSYIAASYLAAPETGGTVDLWLVTPLLNAATGIVDFTFSTRTDLGIPGDSLEILVNNKGTDLLTDFVSLGSIVSGSYPTDWTSFTFQYYGLNTDIRFAFRYVIEDTLAGGDYIGIDSVVAQSVPEPGTLALMAMGMLLTPLVLRRRRARA